MHHARVAALAFAATALVSRCDAAVVSLDARPAFNADVVVNQGAGAIDPTQDPIDLGNLASDNFCFPTASVASRLAPVTPNGLPDDAFFPADAFHPDVRLWWNDTDDGLNARRVAAMTDSFTLPIPPGRYDELHLFATGGDGSADIRVTIAYDTGDTDTSAFLVPDWFDDPVATADSYFLVNGLDRLQVGSGPGTPYAYEDRDDAAIFGFRMRARAGLTATALTIERTDTTGVFDFFGAAVVEARPAPALYESQQARGLLDPANVVATDVASPYPWTPPPADLLFYFVDDGAGLPDLIFVTKGGSGLVFWF